MKNVMGGVAEDTLMNTMVDADDFGRIDPTGPNEPASWDEIEEENVMLNPDAESFEGRG
ncbi:MAG: hypothetical protein LBV18_04700 [Alistipes sp.]|jgi:hypothetical protein|nr:hypothetical protein [Alistipes sp.]